LKIFATIDNNIDKLTPSLVEITLKIKKYFRVIYLPKINAEYVV
jgi:hypothetical protein